MSESLNLSHRFPGDNSLDIPMLAHTPLRRVPDWLIPYRQRTVDREKVKGAGLHFFVEDYRFEAVWNRPGQVLKGLQTYEAVLTPDFSLYRDWPLVAQMWNVYRSRWCGAYWQANGLTVIPTVSWSTVASYEFCFLGIPRHSVVAVATVGLRWRQDETAHALFVSGFREMVRQLSPSLVLCYGGLPAVCEEWAAVKRYATRWQARRGSGGAGERGSGGAGEMGSRGAGEQGSRGAGEQGAGEMRRLGDEETRR